MSEPKRYDVGMTTEFNPHGFNHSFPRVYESEQGRYVEYEDYARLKAAFDLLDESIKLGPSTIPLSHGYYIWKESEQYALKAENARLKADVERLKENEVCYKANIYEMGRRIEGLKEDLEIERSYIARLKAEVDVWKDMVAENGVACNERARENQDLENQIERLKAEVERSNNLARIREKELSRIQIENDLLKAEVERLTVADDAVKAYHEGDVNGFLTLCAIWHAAKEGKQSK